MLVPSPLFLRHAGWLLLACAPAHASQFDIAGPPGSVSFGKAVTVLPNGNIVVTDPDGWVSGAGAVYLYSPNGTLLNTITGGQANDHVGSGGITVLKNGHYVISSPSWHSGADAGAGAVTWGNAASGVTGGVVSATNSLVGSSANDQVGKVTALANGNYVVSSRYWDYGFLVVDAGAVTWGNGAGGTSGTINTGNSLLGTHNGDFVGQVAVLNNGNYVACSPNWNNGIGAATWGNGTTGTTGAVAAGNSLIGAAEGDAVGLSCVTPLSNGHYVVCSSNWANGNAIYAGAVTWGNGNTGTAGIVTSANSLVGSQTNDAVGINGAVALSNGNYVVSSPVWKNGSTAAAGAATWRSGAGPSPGVVTPANSLVGTTAYDYVSGSSSQSYAYGITALANGHYVVASPLWSNGASNVGAVTWANGASGAVGPVAAGNSLIGDSAADAIGLTGVHALPNGNYVVRSSAWHNVAISGAGAITWRPGNAASPAIVSAANSLIGTHTDDTVGSGGFAALANGHYVVTSPMWDNGGTADAGAATWGNGNGGTVGAVSAANSLVSTDPSDRVGLDGVAALGNGHYVVASSFATQVDAGAATWLRGDGPTSALVSIANSLVGSNGNPRFAQYGVTALANGNFVVNSGNRITLSRGYRPVSPNLGGYESVNTTTSPSFAYDAARDQLVVGVPAFNKVTIVRLDELFRDGFD